MIFTSIHPIFLYLSCCEGTSPFFPFSWFLVGFIQLRTASSRWQVLVYWKQENRRCVCDDSMNRFCKFTDIGAALLGF